MRKDHDRRAAAQGGHIFLHPLELLMADLPQRGLTIADIRDIHQTDEMNALVIEALPAGSHRAFAETLQITLASFRRFDQRPVVDASGFFHHVRRSR